VPAAAVILRGKLKENWLKIVILLIDNFLRACTDKGWNQFFSIQGNKNINLNWSYQNKGMNQD